MALKAQSTKRKINTLDFMKIKSISSVKDSVKMKRQATDWEKIFSDYMSIKELVSKIHKELSKRTWK